MEQESSRNMIIFMVCALVMVVLYNTFVMEPIARRRQAEARQAQATQQQAAQLPGSTGTDFVNRSVLVGGTPRIKVDTPSLAGTISLVGARIDDLFLKRYQQTTDPKSPSVELLRPEGVEHAWFAEFSWMGENVSDLPGGNTLWSAPAGSVLTPSTPVVLTYDNGHGLTFRRTISVDPNYMFAISDSVTNATGHPVSLRSYARVLQNGLPADPAISNIVHEGAIGEVGGQLEIARYDCTFGQLFCTSWKKNPDLTQKGTGGWVGITQKYWLSAVIPDQSTPIEADYRIVSDKGSNVYEAGYVEPLSTVASGATLTQTAHLFAGAKTVPLLQSYEKTLGIPRFDQAVDWGVYWFFTQPLFTVLEILNQHLGNIGLALLALTVIVKFLFFPLANKSYESMSKMKKIQPQIEAIKKKYESDPTKMQQETMALYQTEKINPLMGCLPMLVQIPVFYSLYKILTVTIEMRHAPFYGWIHDLSSKDPTTVWNLFGLIPWRPELTPLIGGMLDHNLHIGLWPLIYGFSMWLSQAMNPPQSDPTQKMIFQLMPVIFTFTMSQFTVGLVIYWAWQNALSILQQYFIMHRLKVENPIDTFVARLTGGPKVPG